MTRICDKKGCALCRATTTAEIGSAGAPQVPIKNVSFGPTIRMTAESMATDGLYWLRDTGESDESGNRVVEPVLIGDVPEDEVETPSHYTYLGDEIIAAGGPEYTEDLETWDIIDVVAAGDPLIWNTMKYLVRAGRKGAKITDLRKALAYLNRAIDKEEHVS